MKSILENKLIAIALLNCDPKSALDDGDDDDDDGGTLGAILLWCLACLVLWALVYAAVLTILPMVWP